MKPISFVEKYDKIIFDMDGVLTTERNYWTCAALTVYELYYSDQYFGNRSLNIQDIFNNRNYILYTLFCDGKTISLLKNFGVNTNWDLAYLTIAAMMDLGMNRDYERIYDYYKNLQLVDPDIYQHAQKILEQKLPNMDCSRFGEFWKTLQKCFNAWYYGDHYYQIAYGEQLGTGKTGLIEGEEPMFPVKDTAFLLKTLKDSGKVLGIGTGRPQFELDTPLNRWDLYQYFDKGSIVTNTVVTNAQEEFGQNLTKPNPYSFLRAAFADDVSDQDILDGNYDSEYLKKVLVVGDAGADILAAQTAGMDFLAVLTGTDGKVAKSYFEENGATYILDNVLRMIQD